MKLVITEYFLQEEYIRELCSLVLQKPLYILKSSVSENVFPCLAAREYQIRLEHALGKDSIYYLTNDSLLTSQPCLVILSHNQEIVLTNPLSIICVYLNKHIGSRIGKSNYISISGFQEAINACQMQESQRALWVKFNQSLLVSKYQVQVSQSIQILKSLVSKKVQEALIHQKRVLISDLKKFTYVVRFILQRQRRMKQRVLLGIKVYQLERKAHREARQIAELTVNEHQRTRVLTRVFDSWKDIVKQRLRKF